MSQKISEMTEATTLGDDDMFVIVQDSSGENRRISKANLNTALSGYKKYVALLTQTGTNAPVATVLENTLGFTPVWTYDNTGRYYLFYTDGFTLAKTIAFISQNQSGFILPRTTSSSGSVILNYGSNANLVNLISTNYAGDTYINDNISKLSIEIRVYP